MVTQAVVDRVLTPVITDTCHPASQRKQKGQVGLNYRPDTNADGAQSGVPSRLNELVYSVLRQHIVDGAFADGLVLRENAVAEAFGVGRAPARMALRKLQEESLVRKRQGHGFMVAARGTPRKSLHLPLEDAGLILPLAHGERVAKRNWRQHIYPAVEQTVAACLIYGRFRINQSGLADYFGVSRTVAHEVLTSLERVGFVRQGANARWYAGPLTVQDMEEGYEMRWLLEPPALTQAAKLIPRSDLLKAREDILGIQAQKNRNPEDLNRIEFTLHTDLVLRCTNRQMRTVLRNCQLPIIVSYGTVVRNAAPITRPSGVPETLDQHLGIIESLLTGDVGEAARQLETHIRHGYQYSMPHFVNPPPLAPERVPPYMVLED